MPTHSHPQAQCYARALVVSFRRDSRAGRHCVNPRKPPHLPGGVARQNNREGVHGSALPRLCPEQLKSAVARMSAHGRGEESHKQFTHKHRVLRSRTAATSSGHAKRQRHIIIRISRASDSVRFRSGGAVQAQMAALGKHTTASDPEA